MVSGFLFFWGDPQLLYMLLDLHETGCILFFCLFLQVPSVKSVRLRRGAVTCQHLVHRSDTDQTRLIPRRISSLKRAETMTVTVLLLLGKYYLLIKIKIITKMAKCPCSFFPLF